MAKRRSRGDGGIRWSASRQRWIAEVTIGYRPNGKRIVKSGSGKTKTAAKKALDDIMDDYREGIAPGPEGYTVADAVNDWLTYGLSNRSEATRANRRTLAETHIIPAVGARKLRGRPGDDNVLSADDVDKWLAEKANYLATSTLQRIRGMLANAIRRAQARDKVSRNVVLLCDCPTGKEGRRSKSLTLEQAVALLAAAGKFRTPAIRAYIVVSLLTGARTEEMRALTWSHVDLAGNLDADPPIPASISVWRSVRIGGDTKTKKSRRTLAMPQRCVDVLTQLRDAQAKDRDRAGHKWEANDLVCCTRTGGPLMAGNVRRAFRRVAASSGLEADDWTPRELRHSFVSLLSNSGRVPIEEISRLVGHKSSEITELIYRHELRPVLQHGATVMDDVFRKES